MSLWIIFNVLLVFIVLVEKYYNIYKILYLLLENKPRQKFEWLDRGFFYVQVYECFSMYTSKTFFENDNIANDELSRIRVNTIISEYD